MTVGKLQLSVDTGTEDDYTSLLLYKINSKGIIEVVKNIMLTQEEFNLLETFFKKYPVR